MKFLTTLVLIISLAVPSQAFFGHAHIHTVTGQKHEPNWIINPSARRNTKDVTTSNLTAARVTGSNSLDGISSWSLTSSTTGGYIQFGQALNSPQLKSKEVLCEFSGFYMGDGSTFRVRAYNGSDIIVQSAVLLNVGTGSGDKWQEFLITFPCDPTPILRIDKVTGASSTTMYVANLFYGLARQVASEPPKRNYIINGNFDIWQRGTSLGSGSSYRLLADRWVNSSTSTYEASRQTFSLGQTDVPNEPTYFYRKVVTSSSGAANFTQLLHFIEDVRTLAGKTVTLSFWAKADATKNIALELQQGFGTGGSPSASVNTYLGQVTLTTSWQKFTATAIVPSVAGKTLGTDGPHTSSLRLTFWLEAGSDFNARTGSLGNQSGTFDFAQVQLEEGPTARPFQVKSYAEELRDCQRYYAIIGNDGNFSLGRVYNSSGGVSTLMQTIYFPVPMRRNPTVTAKFDINDGTPSETPTTTHIETTHVVVGADTGSGHHFDMRRVIADAEY